MKIPVITWTVLELGSRNPVARDLFTKTRRCVGRFIAGEDVTRKDFEKVQSQLDNIEALLQTKDRSHEQDSQTHRMAHQEVRPRPVRTHAQPQGTMETCTRDGEPPIPPASI